MSENLNMAEPSTQLITPEEFTCFEGLKLLEKLLACGQFVPASEIKKYLLKAKYHEMARAFLVAKIMNLEDVTQFLPELNACRRSDDDDDDDDYYYLSRSLLSEAISLNSPGRVNYLLALYKTLPLFGEDEIVFAARVAAEFGKVECLQMLLNESSFDLKHLTETMTDTFSEIDGFENDSHSEDDSDGDSSTDGYFFGSRINWLGREPVDAPLYMAAQNGKAECVRILLDSGFPVDGPRRSSITPLFAACKHGHLDVVRNLLEAGADVNRVAIFGTKILPMTLSIGLVDCARELINAGASVNCPDSDGWSPLLIAASGGFEDIASMLIERGADLNAKNHIGLTPLHYAVIGHNDALVRLLIAAGADTTVKADDGTSLQELARSENFRMPLQK